MGTTAAVHLLRRDLGGAAERVVQVIETAVAERRVVVIDQLDRTGRAIERRVVEPFGFSGGQVHWYLTGWCRTRASSRCFRLDRIRRAELTEEVLA